MPVIPDSDCQSRKMRSWWLQKLTPVTEKVQGQPDTHEILSQKSQELLSCCGGTCPEANSRLNWRELKLTASPQSCSRSGLRSRARAQAGSRAETAGQTDSNGEEGRGVKARGLRASEAATVNAPWGCPWAQHDLEPRKLPTVLTFQMPRQLHRSHPFLRNALLPEAWLISKKTPPTWSTPVLKRKLTKTSFLSFGSLIIKSLDCPHSCSSFLVLSYLETPTWCY